MKYLNLKQKLMAAMLMCAAVSQAGHYEITSFDPVGDWESDGAMGYITGPYGYTANSCGAGPSTGGGIWLFGMPLLAVGPGTAACSGTMTANFQYYPDTGETIQSDPPPKTLFIREVATASYSGDSAASGACDPGMTDNLVTTPNYDGGTPQLLVGYTKTATKYWIKSNPGSSFTLSLSPSANVSRSNVSPPMMIGGGCSVNWTIDQWPIEIVLGGMTADPADNKVKKILPGQKLTASLDTNGAPITITSYSWNVTGCRPFEDWDPNVNVRGPATAYSADTTSTTFAYFRENGTANVACAFNYSVDGTSPSITGSGSTDKDAPVIDVPDSFDITVTQVFAYPQPPIPTWGVPSGLQYDHATFGGYVSTPAPFYDPTGTHTDPGEWCHVQVIKRSTRKARDRATPPVWHTLLSHNPWDVRDGSFPYLNGGPYDADGTSTFQVDYPGTTTSNIGAISGLECDDEFETFMMYKPPGTDSKWVAIHKHGWKWDAITVWNGLIRGGYEIWTLDPSSSAALVGTKQKWPNHPEWTGVN